MKTKNRLLAGVERHTLIALLLCSFVLTGCASYYVDIRLLYPGSATEPNVAQTVRREIAASLEPDGYAPESEDFVIASRMAFPDLVAKWSKVVDHGFWSGGRRTFVQLEVSEKVVLVTVGSRLLQSGVDKAEVDRVAALLRERLKAAFPGYEIQVKERNSLELIS